MNKTPIMTKIPPDLLWKFRVPRVLEPPTTLQATDPNLASTTLPAIAKINLLINTGASSHVALSILCGYSVMLSQSHLLRLSSVSSSIMSSCCPT